MPCGAQALQGEARGVYWALKNTMSRHQAPVPCPSGGPGLRFPISCLWFSAQGWVVRGRAPPPPALSLFCQQLLGQLPDEPPHREQSEALGGTLEAWPGSGRTPASVLCVSVSRRWPRLGKARRFEGFHSLKAIPSFL